MEKRVIYLKLDRFSQFADMNLMQNDTKKFFELDMMDIPFQSENIGRRFLSAEVDASLTSHVFEDLELYAYYYISLRACYAQNDQNLTTICTSPIFNLTKTNHDYHANRVENVRAKSLDSSSIEVSWDIPQKINSVILTFDINYRIVGNNTDTKTECVPFLKFKTSNRSKIINNLVPGNYSIALAVRSLHASGSLSKEIYVEVEEDLTTFWTLNGLAVLTTVLIVLIVILCCFNRKRQIELLELRENPNYWPTPFIPHDDEFMLQRKSVELIRELGAGHFGQVYEGILRKVDDDGEEALSSVAVKTVSFPCDHSFVWSNFHFLP